jgi:hypothetical protein
MKTKTKTKVGYLFNVETKTVSKVEVGDYTTIYPFIGNGCTAFDCVRVDDKGDTLYVDDEGLMKVNRLFGIKTQYGEGVLAGNALLLGSTPSGDSCPPKMSLEAFKKLLGL